MHSILTKLNIFHLVFFGFHFLYIEFLFLSIYDSRIITKKKFKKGTPYFGILFLQMIYAGNFQNYNKNSEEHCFKEMDIIFYINIIPE